MSFFRINQAALNEGVSRVVAGAALALALGAVQAEGVRNVLPTANAAASSIGTATGTHTKPGGSGFVAASTLQATPALLILNAVDITASSALVASHTEAYAPATLQFQVQGFITRPGNTLCAGVSAGAAEPLVDVGFATNLVSTSYALADASVKLNGQTTWQRDGYATGASGGSFQAGGLRTALAFTGLTATSGFSAESLKTHGGAAQLAGHFSAQATGATDSAQSLAVSDCKANGTAIRMTDALMATEATLSADGTHTAMAATESSSTSEMTAIGRYAYLGFAQGDSTSKAMATGLLTAGGGTTYVSQSTLVADALLALQGEATADSLSDMTADGRPWLYADTVVLEALSGGAAEGWYGLQGEATFDGLSVLSADARRAEQSGATLGGVSSLAVDGLKTIYGGAQMPATTTLAADGLRLKLGGASMTGESSLSADPLTVVDDLDPPERTMYRPFADRTMRRPFIDRTMRRAR